MSDHDDIESRLGNFRPRRPAAIPDERLQRLRGPIWVAVAAGLAATMFVSARLQSPGKLPAPPGAVTVSAARSVPTLGALTALAVERPDELDAALARISRETLPDVAQAGGVLQRLSKL
jgi:hypothetical protein